MLRWQTPLAIVYNLATSTPPCTLTHRLPSQTPSSIVYNLGVPSLQVTFPNIFAIYLSPGPIGYPHVGQRPNQTDQLPILSRPSQHPSNIPTHCPMIAGKQIHQTSRMCKSQFYRVLTTNFLVLPRLPTCFPEHNVFRNDSFHGQCHRR